MSIVGWIVVGFLAGALSGTVVPGRSARGCLPNILVGVLGGIVGGFLAQRSGLAPIQGFVAAVVVAFIGAVVVRAVLEFIARRT